MSTPISAYVSDDAFFSASKTFHIIGYYFVEEKLPVRTVVRDKFDWKEGRQKIWPSSLYIFPVFLISESVFYLAISLPISKLKSERSWIPAISRFLLELLQGSCFTFHLNAQIFSNSPPCLISIPIFYSIR